MGRKYSKELLDKIIERQEVVNIKGAKVLVKNLPDSDEKGAMDPRLYKNMKKQFILMKLLPRKMIKMDTSPKGIKKLRKIFGNIKSTPIVEKKIDIIYKKVLVSDGYKVPIRIYKSETSKENVPILYYIHGGGFFGGSLDVVEELVKLIVEKTDILAISVDYRLAPENPYPTGHKDCYSVLEWIYDNSIALGGDKKNIFIAGDSAGGNLTQYCTTRDFEAKTGMVKGQLLLYPTVNINEFKDEFYKKWSIEEYEMSQKYRSGLEIMLYMFNEMLVGIKEILGVYDNDQYVTPYIRDPKGLPPTFITVGEHDYLNVECLAYAAKLTKAGVDTTTILYKGFGHAYGENIGVYPQSEDCAIEMSNFILKHSK